MTSEFTIVTTTQKSLDSLGLLDPERFIAIDYALRYYFFVERHTRGRTWSDIRYDPSNLCNCYSCIGRINRWLESNRKLIGKVFPYNA